MTPSEILLKAADLIEQKGWTQGAYARSGEFEVSSLHREATCYCTIGAIICATGEARMLGRGVVDGTKARLFAMIGDHDIVSWNDTPGRTKEEVVEALRRAAQ